MKSTNKKLKKLFASYGTPEQMESDNNSKEFADLALEKDSSTIESHHNILGPMVKQKVL